MLLIIGLIAGFATPLAADIGRVTVNGELLPSTLFTQYALTHGANRLCPPTSDDFIREDVVMMHLLVREGERLGITSTNSKYSPEASARTALETMPTNATPQRRAQLKYELFRSRAFGYREKLVGEAS